MWIWRESLPKYISTIIKSFLDNVLTTIFGINTLSKNSFIHLLTKSRGYTIKNISKYIYFIMEFHKFQAQTEALEQQWQISFIGFRYEDVKLV